MISKTNKTFRFFWVHINLIQELSHDELERYCKSISMAVWPSDTMQLIYQAVDIRKAELLNTTSVDNLVAHSQITLQDL